MKKILMILAALIILSAIAVPVTVNAKTADANCGIPTFSIVSVITDQKVTIQTDNFPANVNFNVLFGAYGTLGIGGTLVGTINSGTGGAFQETFAIPASVQGMYQIAIRLQDTSHYYFAYNWFYNNTSGIVPPPPPPPYYGIPTIAIQSVVTDTGVTIVANNFPANINFNVLMGAYGTLGIGGIQVATVNSGGGGSFTATYNIPTALKGAYQIAIRLQDASDYYYAFNWFYNNTSSVVPPPPPLPYLGVPTFYIQSVVQNTSVTIVTNNFPANDTFKVYMGYYGTLGIGGIQVASVGSGSGGSFTATYSVPAALAGQTRIAIRLQDTNNFYYAYNWFWNYTAP